MYKLKLTRHPEEEEEEEKLLAPNFHLTPPTLESTWHSFKLHSQLLRRNHQKDLLPETMTTTTTEAKGLRGERGVGGSVCVCAP